MKRAPARAAAAKTAGFLVPYHDVTGASEEWSLPGSEPDQLKHFLAVRPGGVRRFLLFVTFSPASSDKLEFHFFCAAVAAPPAPSQIAGMKFHG